MAKARGKAVVESAIAAAILVTLAFLVYHAVAGPTTATTITITTTSGFDASTWIGTGAAIAAIGAALVALWTLRRTSATVGAQTMYETYVGWDSQRIRQARTNAARALEPKLSANQDWSNVHLTPDVNDVLNYIELIGVYVCDDRVIAPDQAWTGFTGFVVPWFEACAQRIAQARDDEGDDTIFTSAERLYRLLCKYDAQKRTAARRARGRALEKRAKKLTGPEKASELARAEELKRTNLKAADVAYTREDILDYLRGEAELEGAKSAGLNRPTSGGG